MKRIIFLNAPPASGKTEVAKIFHSLFNYIPLGFKGTLVKATIDFYGVSEEWWLQGYTPSHKNVPEPLLKGLSRRQALIYYSEELAKPVEGNQVWAKGLHKTIEKYDDNLTFIIDDLGFDYEAQYFLDKEEYECHLIYVHREGTGFDINGVKDSRQWVDKDLFLPPNVWHIQNDKDIVHLETECDDIDFNIKLRSEF